MRPKLLEIEGLQSFRELQKINFTELGETGLFGIFGPTGSGKSTILDAITFALYGKVKRAERGTQGIINTNLNTARVSFTFEILKGSSRKTYRVERTYQRKKGSDNSCEPKIARLIEVTGVGEIPVCDKASEVSSSIEELLGLSHDDFTRAVVLPQNSFQEFLLLDNAKKREMLERIFYLEKYGKELGEKLNSKMARLKSRVDRLSGELAAYADASEVALEEAQKALERAVQERTRLEKELKLLEAKYIEARDVWQLVQELSIIRHKEDQHLASREAVNVKRARLEKAMKADGLLEIIQNKKELSLKLGETEKQLQEVLDRLPAVTSGLRETRQKYEDIKKEAAREQPRLIGLKTRLLDALRVKAEIEAGQEKMRGFETAAAKLQREIAGKSGAIAKEAGEITALEQSIKRLREGIAPLQTDPEYRQQLQEGARLEHEVETLAGNVTELSKKVKTWQGVVTGLEQRLEQVNEVIARSQKALDILRTEKEKHEAFQPGDRNLVLQDKEDLHALQQIYDLLKLRKNELNGLNSRLAKQQSTLRDFTKKMFMLQERKTQAEILYEQSRLELEQAVKALDRNTAYLLSKNLKEGEACPVCGSQHHPRPAVQTGEAELAVLEGQAEMARKQLALAEKELKEADKGYLVAGEQVKALQEQVKQAVEELDLKTKEYRETQLRLPAELQAMELEQLHLELDRRNSLSAEKLKAVESWEKREAEYQGELQKITEKLSQDRLVEKGIATELKVNRVNREQSAQALLDGQAILHEKRQKHLEFLQRHQIAGAATELKRLAENDRQINVLQKQMAASQELLTKKLALLEQLKEELRVLNNENIKIEADSSNLRKQISATESRLQELAGEANIEEEIQGIDKKLEEYLKLEKQYQDSLRIFETQHHELTTQESLLANQRNIYTANLQSEEGKLTKALLDQGFADSAEVEEAIITKEKQQAWHAEITEYEQAARNIQAQKEMVQKKLGSRSITDTEWHDLSNAYREMAAYKEECVSKSEVAKNTFNILKEKHSKWVELNTSCNELTNKYGLFEQIHKLLRAERGKDNSFIDFIAEERLRYVAAQASEILGVMTKYKYALELDSDAGFIIRDNANGGVHRLVTSLSGGEIFLTSLSLALSLSEQIQLKGQSPLELFFLDEGFGTLDQQLLDTVIDSLERLSKKERVIGLISHVPELKSRIARRLIVEPPSSRGDGSRVRLEKA